MRTSFHHQPEAQHPKSPAIETPAGRLPHLSVRFDNLVKYDCKIKEGAVGPGVVPRASEFNNLQCQTSLTALTGAKGIFLRCQTEIVTKPDECAETAPTM